MILTESVGVVLLVNISSAGAVMTQCNRVDSLGMVLFTYIRKLC